MDILLNTTHIIVQSDATQTAEQVANHGSCCGENSATNKEQFFIIYKPSQMKCIEEESSITLTQNTMRLGCACLFHFV